MTMRPIGIFGIGTRYTQGLDDPDPKKQQRFESGIM
jgi:hypothetical protein